MGRGQRLELNYLEEEPGGEKTVFYSVDNLLQRQERLRFKREEPQTTHAPPLPPPMPPPELLHHCCALQECVRQTAEEDGEDGRQLKVGILAVLVFPFLHHLSPSFIALPLKTPVLVFKGF